MERVGTLIYKLLEQYQLQTQPGQMMMTAQMLLTELQQCEMASQSGLSNKVTVVIPSIVQQAPEPVRASQPVVEKTITVSTPPPAPPPQPQYQPQQYQQYQPAATWQSAPQQPAYQTRPSVSYIAPEPEPEEVVEQPAIPSIPPAAVQQSKGWQYDPVHDVPTLLHQEVAAGPADINERMKAGNNGESLNEKLRVEKSELGSVLQEAPIRDLKKAIGINDRYLFINELFRGDETMYERSLKTINGFNILPEAQYWIQRELKVKLGWLESSEAVSHFDQLVKRRFA